VECYFFLRKRIARWRPGVKAGKAVLTVNPYYPDASRKAHNEGKVIVNCVIGTDGLVHDPVIEKGTTKELNKLALDVLTFYRFEPAHDGDHAVAVKVPFEISFQAF
jgi:TonB family protein